MADSVDAWRLLREKRRKKASDNRAHRKNQPLVTPPERRVDPPRRKKPKNSGLLSRERAVIAANPVPRPSPTAVLVKPGASGKRKRHLIHVDMVSAENREAIEHAAKADGRTLSQWCRILLLRAAQDNR